MRLVDPRDAPRPEPTFPHPDIAEAVWKWAKQDFMRYGERRPFVLQVGYDLWVELRVEAGRYRPMSPWRSASGRDADLGDRMVVLDLPGTGIAPCPLICSVNAPSRSWRLLVATDLHGTAPAAKGRPRT